MSTLIHAQSLSKRYGNNLALDDISFEIQAGSPVALVGPNGAGKTTLFSLLCGYILPTQGQLRIFEYAPGSSHLFGKLSALPQDAQLDPRFSVVHQLAFYAQLQGLSVKQSQAEALRVLDLVGLSDVANHRADALSHGMRKRATIAQALIGKPRIVMLDEPTAGLDPIHAREVRELVASLSDEATFILSSHDLSELERLCTQVLYLNKGKLTEHQGNQHEQTTQYFMTLLLADDYNDVEKHIKTLNGVKRVYKSQAKEYVIEYQKSDILFDIALINFCHLQGWRYRQLVNGHTLENQIFTQEQT